VATTAESSDWHDMLRQQMISLAQRPGHGLPEDATTLDQVEEAIHHALEAGRPKEAQDLYQNVLGGLRHLAWKLGEMPRGLRILRQFQPCPDPWSLAWFLRASGELEEAYRHNNLPYFRADIRLLQGRLPQVAAEQESLRTGIAAFLMGQTTYLPSEPLGAAIPRDQLLLYLGKFSKVQQSNLLDDFYHQIGWEGDRARCLLILAETAIRQNDFPMGRKHLEAASHWILHSGSVEHLCLMHLVRARLERLAGDGGLAQRAVEEGLHLARQCGLGLYHVELLCEQVQGLIGKHEAAQAESLAREALRLASHAECQFAWGAAEAGHLLGQALQLQHKNREARAILDHSLGLRRRIGHPRVAETEHLLALTSEE
jgi:hypothetical protein